jgi:hypothetical protein
MSGMRDFILLFVHVIVTAARLAGPGGLAPAMEACAQPVRHRSRHRRLDRAMAEFTSEVFQENSVGKLGL